MRSGRIGLLSALALTAGCGLINVNGKPLGGGKKTDGNSSSGGGTSSGGGDSGAREGDPTVVAVDKSGLPTWCKEDGYFDSSDHELKDFDPSETPTANDFAEITCAASGDHIGDKPKMIALRDAWMKNQGMDALDFEVAAAQAKGRGWDSQDTDKMSGPVSEVEFAYASNLMDKLDMRGQHASQLGKYNLISTCFQVGLGVNEWKQAPLLQEILCTRVDVNLAKANAEIDANKDLNPGTRFRLRQMVWNSNQVYASASADVTAKAKEDPGIARLVRIADAQKAEWMSPPPARAKLIATLEAMEAATVTNKRSAFAGCEATTKPAWEANVKAGKWPKVPGEHLLSTWLPIAFSTPDGYLAWQAFDLCEAGSDRQLHHDQGLRVLGSDTNRRGFFSATLAAWLAASGDIKFDSRDLEMKDLLGGGRYNDSLSLHEGYRNQKIVKGQIEKITPQKDGTVQLTYKHASITIDDCVKWRDTGRIQSISSSGQLTYESQCTAWGKVKYDITAEPTMISAAMVDGLKVGMFLYSIEDGFPVVATASSSSSKPVWVFGATL